MISSDTVVLTGASGYLGSVLLDVLKEKFQQIVAIYRTSPPHVNSPQILPFCSPLTSSELLAIPLREAHTLIHTAWDHSFSSAPQNLSYLKELLAAAQKAKLKRFVFVSAVGAQYKASTPFLKEKYQAERLLLASSIPQKVIIRLPLLYGSSPGGQIPLWPRLLRNLLRWSLYPVPKIPGRFSTMPVRQAAQSIVENLFQNKQPILQIFSGPETYKMENFLSSLASPEQIPLKGFLSRPLLFILEKTSKFPPSPSLKDFFSLSLPTSSQNLVFCPESEDFSFSRWLSEDVFFEKNQNTI